MSRGGRGGGRGGFGGGGRGGFGANNLPPMGLTFADIQSMSREQSALYPPIESLPVLTEYSQDEKRICELQLGVARRLRKSAYYVTEVTKSTELERYADKYRPSPAARPALKRRELHQPFFPPEIFEDYFNPKKRRKLDKKATTKINLDDLGDDAEEQEKSEESDVGSQAADEDYDVDEEYDNDYAENYFDNGEGDDMDDLGGGGGGGGDEGGGFDYD
ncbi:hypothetical protein BV25DRAFT_1914491 [Artomyces pyxidatus]|uniref:Uncharacterized protein n=1 Tax=Artomyces pyxidatus TaxID=48021 RepID=A0ACB8T693_9AGAM|nr:hypothetical protein BV25DRAFT_1914491 [Artomyces pyxidatus]